MSFRGNEVTVEIQRSGHKSNEKISHNQFNVQFSHIVKNNALYARFAHIKRCFCHFVANFVD